MTTAAPDPAAGQPAAPDPGAPDPGAPDPGAPAPAAPDPAALRRRVVLTGLLSLTLFLVLAVAISTAGLPDWLLVVAVGVGYAIVVRPMMRPVRDASRLRRSLAYQAFRERKDSDR